jgi:protein-L-isoaspartate(D-aspartate) O-methyltransferase
VDPASPIATPTLLGECGFSYLTYRKVDADVFEFGAYAHGADAHQLAGEVVEQVRVWERDHRHGEPAQIQVSPAGIVQEDLPPGRMIRKRHTTVTISWP